MVTVHEICLDADLFRRCFPHWPSPEPESKITEPAPEPGCPDCEAPPGRSCYPDCLRQDGGT